MGCPFGTDGECATLIGLVGLAMPFRASDSDAYGHEVWDCFVGRLGNEVVEGDDGLVDPSAMMSAMYFAPLKDWPTVERSGQAFVKG